MAQDLELRADSGKYEARIAMLEGHVSRIEGLMAGYEALKNRVGDFMGDDDNVASAQRAAEIGIKRCQKAIDATQANIKTLQDILNNLNNVGENIKVILEGAIEIASAGLFD